MNEVVYLDKDLDLVNEFNSLKDKRSELWTDEKYSDLRKTIKDHYLKVQDYTCFFCRQRIVVHSNRAWDTEHIISKSNYPKFMFEPQNLCITCPDCNNEKRDKPVLYRKKCVHFPRKSAAYKIVHPHFDEYDHHLKVIVEGKLYQYLTNKGRYTFQIYGLDRFQMIEAGRNTNDKTRELMKAALMDQENYEQHEKDLLRELIFKYSGELDSRRALNLLVELRR